MKAQVLTGSKREIAEAVAAIGGKVHEAIVFVDEVPGAIGNSSGETIFSEMDAFTVNVGGADYSREAVYPC